MSCLTHQLMDRELVTPASIRVIEYCRMSKGWSMDKGLIGEILITFGKFRPLQGAVSSEMVGHCSISSYRANVSDSAITTWFPSVQPKLHQQISRPNSSYWQLHIHLNCIWGWQNLALIQAAIVEQSLCNTLRYARSYQVRRGDSRLQNICRRIGGNGANTCKIAVVLHSGGEDQTITETQASYGSFDKCSRS